MQRIIGLVIALALLVVGSASAEVSTQANANLEKLTIVGGALQTNGAGSPAASACKTVNVTPVNSGTDVTVDATAGGVTVMNASTTRCGAVITNTSANAMRCAPTTLTVTATLGYLIGANGSLNLGAEGQQSWKCIRTGASSAAAATAEAAP